nr:cytochrome b [Nuttalliella namaqua]
MTKNINNQVMNFPSPSNLSYLWNMGSILGMCMMVQIITGIFLSFHYKNDINMAFMSINHIMRDVNKGWMIRHLHANGASLLFMFMYIHIMRGIYFKSFKYTYIWLTGMSILIIMMMISFLGYILPWGQMSFWAATVITNLITAVPLIGKSLTIWIWGNFSVAESTLTRFFSLHFLMPFMMLFLIIFHITSLHYYSSSNPLGISKNHDKIPFFPFFMIKDLMGFLLTLFLFLILILMFPYIFSDSENFIQANSLITPIHIQPEWYFLFAYAILRSIPNKLGGVIALMMSIMIMLFLPLLNNNMTINSNMNMYKKLLTWMFISTFFMLTMLGMLPAEEPFIKMSLLFTLLYFMMIIFLPL